jgi:hypothetical protein
MNPMVWFIRCCAAYNLSGAASFLVPGALGIVAVALPQSPFWLWLPALFGVFAAIVLLMSARDLHTYGTFPYWNGIIRLVFVCVAFFLDFGDTAGEFVRWLALGDLPLAFGCIIGVPRVTGRSHVDLLWNTRVA